MIAHELAHIRNRDILIQSVAAAIGGAITYLGYMLLWFGGDDDSPLGLIASLALVLLAPIAASIIQLAISRQREYSADADRRPDLRQPREPRLGAAAPRGGQQGDPDEGQRGDGVPLHRQAARTARKAWRACSGPTRRSRSGSAGSVRCAPRWADSAASRARTVGPRYTF